MSKRTLFRFIIPVLVVLALFAGRSSTLAQGPVLSGVEGPAGGAPQDIASTAFTYQGRLQDSAGNPVTGTCDFTFSLWDALTSGTQVGTDCLVTGTAVVDGYFSVQLNAGGEFGTAFQGDARWLQIAVQCTGDPAATTLDPRQELTATPYALSLRPGARVVGSITSGAALRGENTATDGQGVLGVATAISGTAYGVLGRSASTEGAGVRGRASATSGTTYGVYGLANSTDGTGVYGIADASSGSTYGVYGVSASDTGIGVYGEGSVGVYARSLDPGGFAVKGIAGAVAGSGVGVWGESDSTDAGSIGVFGYAAASSGLNFGIYGRSNSGAGFGVAGVGGAGVGVGAWSTSGHLVEAYSGDFPWGTLQFYITQVGDVYANGTYNTFKALLGADGQQEVRALHTVQSPEAWSEDAGTAQLRDGLAIVPIEALFAQTVNLEVPYHVFLTPLGADDVILRVADKGPASFTVRGVALDGKPANCSFDYRIMAKPRGSEGLRLEQIDVPLQRGTSAQEGQP